MTNYKNIFGKPVKFLSADPDNAEAEGQIWYNSTSDTFKSIVALEAWSAGSPLILGRTQSGAAGTQTAAIAFGGINPAPPATLYANTELYDGTNWSTTTAMATARGNLSGSGANNTAALAAGGENPGVTNATEEFTGAFNVTRTLTTS